MLRRLKAPEALERLAGAAGLSPHGLPGDVPSDQLLAEYLRRTLTLLAEPDADSAWSPVYVTSITGHVRRQLAPLWPSLGRAYHRRPSLEEQQREGDTAPDSVRRVLESLDDLREVVHLGHGYWLPSPVRFIEMPADDRVLVIGGLSTSDLRRLLHPRLEVSWIARLLKKDCFPSDVLADRARWQAFHDWMGSPPRALRDWTASKIQSATRGLAPSAANVVEFEVYVPQLKGREPQFFRWVKANELGRSARGLLLCRASEGRWAAMRRYWLGTVTEFQGQLRAEKEYPVEPCEVRRLQYGFDLLSERPTTAVLRRGNQDITLEFRSLLPPEERRLVIALAKDESPQPGRLPQVYRASREHEGTIRHAMEGLGVTVALR